MRSKAKLVYAALQDIQKNINLVRGLVANLDFESFSLNWEKIYSATRCLEIISEASRRLPEEMRARHSHISWQHIAAAGNFYRHQYDDVETLKIWNTVQKDLAPLLAVAESELARLPAD